MHKLNIFTQIYTYTYTHAQLYIHVHRDMNYIHILGRILDPIRIETLSYIYTFIHKSHETFLCARMPKLKSTKPTDGNFNPKSSLL